VYSRRCDELLSPRLPEKIKGEKREE
jgi:hypothetical protein